MTRLFLDTEWADTMASELVSLALVSEDGLHRYYAEVNPLPVNPTDFVRNTVYPLLEHGYSAMQPIDLTRSLRRFLIQFQPPIFVLFDYPVDGALFRYALEGFESTVTQVPCPEVTLDLVRRDDISSLIERYFMAHPELIRRRHHAGVDAEALRWAFVEALRTGAMHE